jgi:hypothetical protein
VLGFGDVRPRAVPVLFGAMGWCRHRGAVARPARQALVAGQRDGRRLRRRLFGLDIGQAVRPLLFGTLMDLHRPAQVWLGIAVVQGVLIASAFNVRRVRRTPSLASA